MPFAKVPGPAGCHRYNAGHAIHPSQARLAYQAGSERASELGEVPGVRDSIISVVFADRIRRFQNHLRPGR